MTNENRHIHADLIHKWAEDTTQTVWIEGWLITGWSITNDISWREEFRYHIGPTPPPKMCKLGGLYFPEPLKGAPDNGTVVYIAGGGELSRIRIDKWYSSKPQNRLLNAGILHLTRKAAEQQSEAIAAMVFKAIREAV